MSLGEIGEIGASVASRVVQVECVSDLDTVRPMLRSTVRTIGHNLNRVVMGNVQVS